jgi:serine/threonine protein phosphatase 1
MVARTFIIGDVHGCVATLRRLVTELLHPLPGDHIYLLGDLIDRGPDSKGVLDFIFELTESGIDIRSIRGNHEDMLLKSGIDKKNFDTWISNGGQATLDSFGVTRPADIPQLYRDFLALLPFFFILDDFIIVHAGFDFDLTYPFDDTDAMLWTRSRDVDLRRTVGRRLICGHTPVTRREMEASLTRNKIMLDNGCVFGSLPESGNLAALDLENMKLILQPNIDIQPEG